MAAFLFIMINSALAGINIVAGEVEILTATNDFEIQNGTAEITFYIRPMWIDLDVFISKKYPCLDISEPIYIGGYLTAIAREGIYVTKKGDGYTIHFQNAQEIDKGTYIVSVVNRTANRYEHITSRSINLISSDEDELKIMCNDNGKCNDTGWKAGFAVFFVLFIVILALCIFIFIKFMQLETEEDRKKEEDIYVLHHIGSASTSARENGPTGTYEDLDEVKDDKKPSVNAGATNDDDTYMIPSGDETEKEDDGQQSSEPEDDAPGIPGTKGGGTLSSEYDVPSKVLEPNNENTRDVLDAIPDNRASTSNTAPTLPSHYTRPPKGSVATVASETAVLGDPYERISYGKYARRFQRLRQCNIL